MRGAGTVTALVLVLGWGVAGCSSGGGPDAKASTPADVSSEPVTPEPSVPTEPVFPDTPEGDLDKLAAEKGWTVDTFYNGSASAFVADICESATARQEMGGEPGELIADQAREGDNREILRAGMPTLCPQWSKVALAALKGDYVRTYSGGTYAVKAHPKDFDPSSDETQEIGPGTYRTEGDLADCYWERTSRSGEIIDNQFATSARKITVTIQASDGQFTTRGCGTWKQVK